MNKNVESHFSQLPAANIQRSVFDMSTDLLTSFNVGDLIPVYWREVLPGDTFDVITSKVVRLQTMLTPVMGNMYLDTYWFFVPNRILWSHWQEFMGENKESAWIPETTYVTPKILSPEDGFSTGTIADYLGLPLGKVWSSGKRIPHVFPFRAYAHICNDFFRDENITDPLVIPNGDSNQQGSNGSDYINDVANGGMPFKVAKYHDYFTSCLPSPQKGISPSLSFAGEFIGGNFPVVTMDEFVDPYISVDKDHSLWYYSQNNSEDDPTLVYSYSEGLNDNSAVAPGSVAPAGRHLLAPANLFANIPDQDIGTGSFNINDLRLAFAAQRFLEKNARGGSRYISILRQHFGVISPDSRLQRPEYLGGNRIRLNVSQVLNQAQTEEDFLGDLGAMSVTSDIHSDFQHSFVEHGILMCVCAVRYDHTYTQGLSRQWMRDSIFDYYWPTFANIGEQPVYSNELYFDADEQETVFGYQEAWADYRYHPNACTGEMRPDVDNTLSSWNLADNYEEVPTLSDEWIREDKSNVDRTLSVTSTLANQCFGDFYFKVKATRPMPVYSVPGLIDHN